MCVYMLTKLQMYLEYGAILMALILFPEVMFIFPINFEIFNLK